MNTWRKSLFFLVPIAVVSLIIGTVYTLSSNKRVSFDLPLKKPTALKVPARAPGEPALTAAIPAKAEKIVPKETLPLKIVIPEGSGHVVGGFKADGDGKIIIHIQDIHTNYEAQKNMSRIIETLIKDKGLNLIMVEGGWGDVNLTYLRSYADKDRRQKVGEEYLKAGKISGEEYLDIVSDYKMDLEGLEDETLYKANLDAFFDIEQFRAKAAKELAGIKRVVRRLKEKLYSPHLLELEKAKQDYEDKKITLADYYKRIDVYARKTKQDLSGFANFRNFMRVAESEKDINFQSVEKERSKLIERLSKKLTKQKLTALVTKSLEFRLNKLTPAEYHAYLTAEAESAGENLGKYQNLKKYVAYISSHEKIDTTALFEEADNLVSEIRESLIRNLRQKRLSEISKALTVLENFLNLRLVPKDFTYYKQHKNDFITTAWIDFLKGEVKRNKIRASSLRPAATVDKNLTALVRFYDIANKRDDVFIKNSIRLMNEKAQNIAVLIAGGFHTPPLTQKLKECGISYVVVAPQTTQPTDQKLYRHILKYKSGREK